MNLGTYTEYAGRRAVRIDREFARNQQEVWHAVSEPAEMKVWFPSEIDFVPMPGETIRFFGDPHQPDGSHGTVLIHDAPERFAFLWGGDEIHLLVSSPGHGKSSLSLINVLADPATAARNAAGWVVCLHELEKHLDGKRADGPHSADALNWDEVYEQLIAAGVPSGAPIPGRPA